MRIDIAAQSDIGRRKLKNEDYYGIFREDTAGLRLFKEGALLCVADGLGGHSAGEIASKLAVATLKDMLKEPPPSPPSDSEQDQGLLPVLRAAIAKVNDNIFRTNQDLIKNGRPMGTTLLSTIVVPKKVFLGNVGDSRGYHIRDGEILAKTEDHSWVDVQVKMGLMSKSEAESDLRRHVVTRSIGTHPEVELDTYIWHIVPGDMLLLCTDGLINMLKDAEIIEEFRKNASPADIAHRLVTRANDNGGKDNITVLVADISPSLFTVIRRRFLAFSRKRGAKILMFTVGLILLGLTFALGYWLGGGFGVK